MYFKNYYSKVSLFLLLLFLGFTQVLAMEKMFEVKSGLIEYEIKGGGILTEETNITISGLASLVFDDWGVLDIDKEEGTLLLNGAIKHKQEIKRLKKENKEVITIVDYHNEQLLERKKNKDFVQKKAKIEGFSYKGEENILGYVCKLWIGHGIEKCMYKGIVLRQKAEVFGIVYSKIAKTILFDMNISELEYPLPEYQKQSFGLLEKDIEIKHPMKVLDFCTRMKDIQLLEPFVLEKVEKIDFMDKKRQLFVNDIGKDIFNIQKVILPKLLSSLKESRFCLQTAENLVEANECIENFSHLTKKLGTDVEYYIIHWNKERKIELLDKVEEALLFLESRISCINRANNLTDLSTCMK